MACLPPSAICTQPCTQPALPRGPTYCCWPGAPTEVPSAFLQGLCESQTDQRAKALSKTYFFLNGIYCFCLLTTNTVQHRAKGLENTKEAKGKDTISHSTTKEQPLLTEVSHRHLLISRGASPVTHPSESPSGHSGLEWEGTPFLGSPHTLYGP